MNSKHEKFSLKNFPLLLLFYLCLSVAHSSSDEVFSQQMQSRLENRSTPDTLLRINTTQLFGTKTIQHIYQLNKYAPLWSDKSMQDLQTEINAIALDGLNPDDYLIAGKGRAYASLSELSNSERVEQELLLTESLLRLAYHLRFGKVDPVKLDSDWNYSKRLDMTGPAQTVFQVIKDQDIKSLIYKERPETKDYKKLQKLLTQYTELEQAGGWQAVELKKTIKAGDSSAEIGAIKQRLVLSGDYVMPADISAQQSLVYDPTLQAAVKTFQKSHGLDTDGVIGKNTIAAMNISVTDRINQIRVNLERLRWSEHAQIENYLLVDIAAFEAFLVQDGNPVWQAKVQVGKAFTATPIFQGNLQYLEFNPTWTIPPSIIKKTVLPNLKKDANYLNKKGYVLLDFDGNKLDPLKINWKNLNNFPYMVRQPAGKNNALGQVKFIFPNKHFVFLHDTNHRELFNRSQRTFSAGCIRVNKPLDLAFLLLLDNPQWDSREKIQKLIDSGKTKRINTRLRIPVMITYRTVDTDENGQALFKQDIYDRDPAILKALDGPITIADDVKKRVDELSAIQETSLATGIK